MSSSLPTRRQDEKHIAFTSQLVYVYTPKGVEVILGLKGGVAVWGGLGGWVGGVDARRNAEWDETFEGSLGDPTESEEAGCSFWREGGGAELGPAECEGRPGVGRPLWFDGC